MHASSCSSYLSSSFRPIPCATPQDRPTSSTKLDVDDSVTTAEVAECSEVNEEEEDVVINFVKLGIFIVVLLLRLKPLRGTTFTGAWLLLAACTTLSSFRTGEPLQLTFPSSSMTFSYFLSNRRVFFFNAERKKKSLRSLKKALWFFFVLLSFFLIFFFFSTRLFLLNKFRRK
jgi:hypothetical protein